MEQNNNNQQPAALAVAPALPPWNLNMVPAILKHVPEGQPDGQPQVKSFNVGDVNQAVVTALRDFIVRYHVDYPKDTAEVFCAVLVNHTALREYRKYLQGKCGGAPPSLRDLANNRTTNTYKCLKVSFVKALGGMDLVTWFGNYVAGLNDEQFNELQDFCERYSVALNQQVLDDAQAAFVNLPETIVPGAAPAGGLNVTPPRNHRYELRDVKKAGRKWYLEGGKNTPLQNLFFNPGETFAMLTRFQDLPRAGPFTSFKELDEWADANFVSAYQPASLTLSQLEGAGLLVMFEEFKYELFYPKVLGDMWPEYAARIQAFADAEKAKQANTVGLADIKARLTKICHGVNGIVDEIYTIIETKPYLQEPANIDIFLNNIKAAIDTFDVSSGDASNNPNSSANLSHSFTRSKMPTTLRALVDTLYGTLSGGFRVVQGGYFDTLRLIVQETFCTAGIPLGTRAFEVAQQLKNRIGLRSHIARSFGGWLNEAYKWFEISRRVGQNQSYESGFSGQLVTALSPATLADPRRLQTLVLQDGPISCIFYLLIAFQAVIPRYLENGDNAESSENEEVSGMYLLLRQRAASYDGIFSGTGKISEDTFAGSVLRGRTGEVMMNVSGETIDRLFALAAIQNIPRLSSISYNFGFLDDVLSGDERGYLSADYNNVFNRRDIYSRKYSEISAALKAAEKADSKDTKVDVDSSSTSNRRPEKAQTNTKPAQENRRRTDRDLPGPFIPRDVSNVCLYHECKIGDERRFGLGPQHNTSNCPCAPEEIFSYFNYENNRWQVNFGQTKAARDAVPELAKKKLNHPALLALRRQLMAGLMGSD